MPTAVTNKVRFELYNGRVVVDFYPNAHRVKLIKVGNLNAAELEKRQKSLLSVTAAVGVVDKSRPLILWALGLCNSHIRQYLEERAGESFTAEELYPVIEEAIKQHQIKKEEAATFGDLVHSFAEEYAAHKAFGTKSKPTVNPEWPEPVLNGINAFLEWNSKHHVEYLWAERFVYSIEHNYFGFNDNGALVDGKKAVNDYKTSKGVYSDQFYQKAAYWKALEEEDGVPFDLGYILHFNKETGQFEAHPTEREEYEKDFAAFLGCLSVKRREKERNPNRW